MTKVTIEEKKKTLNLKENCFFAKLTSGYYALFVNDEVVLFNWTSGGGMCWQPREDFNENDVTTIIKSVRLVIEEE